MYQCFKKFLRTAKNYLSDIELIKMLNENSRLKHVFFSENSLQFC